MIPLKIKFETKVLLNILFSGQVDLIID